MTETIFKLMEERGQEKTKNASNTRLNKGREKQIEVAKEHCLSRGANR